MAAISAGLLLWRRSDEGIEVLIAHPGGPFWARKDAGAWSIPKGEFDPEQEQAIVAAQREFAEETGAAAPPGPYVELGETRLKSGKRIVAWGAEGDFDVDGLASNTFEAEWPPRSGRKQEFPEIDRVAWVSPAGAAEKLNPAQVVFVERLLEVVE